MKLTKISLVIFSALFLLCAGDHKSGESKVSVCSACHGADGNSVVGLWPSLAGQNEKYLLKHLKLVKSGDRVIDSMIGLLDNLDDSDLEDIARIKIDDLNAYTIDQAKEMIRGTARSMGIEVRGK